MTSKNVEMSSNITVVWPQSFLRQSMNKLVAERKFRAELKADANIKNSQYDDTSNNVGQDVAKTMKTIRPMSSTITPKPLFKIVKDASSADVEASQSVLLRDANTKIFIVNPVASPSDASTAKMLPEEIVQTGSSLQTQTLNVINRTCVSDQSTSQIISQPCDNESLKEETKVPGDIDIDIVSDCVQVCDKEDNFELTGSDSQYSLDSLAECRVDVDDTQNVIVEQISPPINDYESATETLQVNEPVLTDLPCTMLESNLNGYGPEFIAEEMEVVETDLITGDMTMTEMTDGGLDNSGCDDVTSDLVETQVEGVQVIDLPTDGDTLIAQQHPSLSARTNLVMTIDSDGTPTISPITRFNAKQVPPWMKQEWKRARDRAKKRSKRADPEYRSKERGEAQERMSNKRQDPEYRARERQRDKERRQAARKNNKAQRDIERERDKIYRRQKSCDPSKNQMKEQTGQLLMGDITSFVDTETVSQRVEGGDLGEQVITANDHLDFTVDDGGQVYEISTKHDQSVDGYS